MLGVCVISGAALFLLAYLSSGLLVSLFVTGFIQPQKEAVRQFATILMWTILWAPVVRLNTLLLNAEDVFGLSYVLLGLQHLLNILALVFFVPRFGFIVLAYAIVASSILGVLIQQVYIARYVGISPRLRRWHPRLLLVLRDSVSLQVGHQIYSLKDAVISSLLSFLPVGSLSLFNYAYRVSGMVLNISTLPLMQVFSSRSARWVANREFKTMKGWVRRLPFYGVGAYAAASLTMGLVMVPLL